MGCGSSLPELPNDNVPVAKATGGPYAVPQLKKEQDQCAPQPSSSSAAQATEQSSVLKHMAFPLRQEVSHSGTNATVALTVALFPHQEDGVRLVASAVDVTTTPATAYSSISAAKIPARVWYCDESLGRLRAKNGVTHSTSAMAKSLAAACAGTLTECRNPKTSGPDSGAPPPGAGAVLFDVDEIVGVVGISQLTVSVTSAKDRTVAPLVIQLAPVSTATLPSSQLFNILFRSLFLLQVKKRFDMAAKAKHQQDLRCSAIEVAFAQNATKLGLAEAAKARLESSVVQNRNDTATLCKTSQQLASRVSALERKCIRLKALQGKEEKNPLDATYEDGGPVPFKHLPAAEPHFPIIRTDELHAERLALLCRAPSQLATMGRTMPGGGTADGDPSIARALCGVETWDFQIFEFDEATGGQALFHLAYHLLHRYGFVETLGLEPATIRRFLGAVQAGYHPNPYHNALHAADVTHVLNFIMHKGGLADKLKLSTEERFAAVMAAVIHDYDHPGYNNNFHIRTSAYLATLYNDRCVLENHHLARIFELCNDDRYNIFAPLSAAQFKTVRETMVEMVLSTDMGLHGKIFTHYKTRLKETGDSMDTWGADKDDKLLGLVMALKMADISNCSRPTHLYQEWAKRIATEFYRQGDAERQLELKVSPFMDRSKDAEEFPMGQTQFMNFVVAPMFESVARALPELDFVDAHIQQNKAYWARDG